MNKLTEHQITTLFDLGYALARSTNTGAYADYWVGEDRLKYSLANNTEIRTISTFLIPLIIDSVMEDTENDDKMRPTQRSD